MSTHPEPFFSRFARESRYSFHSTGRAFFFLVLQALQQGTRLSLVERPPLESGMIWSMVRFLKPTFCLQ